MSPEVPRRASLPRLGSQFRYSGLTQYQTRLRAQQLDRPAPHFQRSWSTGGANCESSSWGAALARRSCRTRVRDDVDVETEYRGLFVSQSDVCQSPQIPAEKRDACGCD